MKSGIDIKDLYIIGAGGFGRETAWLVERINEVSPTWVIRGFIDDNVELHGRQEGGYRILGGCEYFKSLSGEFWVICAIGATRVRRKVVEKLSTFENMRFATVIDPAAQLSDRVIIGEGSIICAGNIITVDVVIGKHNIINLSCTIGHDAVLDDFVTLYPGVNVSGNVTVERQCELGTGAKVIQGKRIRSNSIIGAGAVVIRDIDEAGTYVGVPAGRR